MPARIYKPSFDQSRFDPAQIGGDRYRQMAEQVLIPQIVERQKQALNVVPEFFRFYQRAYHGRRCSCWMGTETSPASACMVCFGSGNTAGYQLYGHTTEVFDTTTDAAAVNVVADYEQVTRPIQMRLTHRALRGYVDFTLRVSGGVNICSLASLHAVASRGTRVRSAVKLFTEPSFTALSQSAISSRLQAAQTSGGLHLRVLLERDSTSTPSPRFSHLRIRYQTLPDDRVRGDIPLSSDGNRSSEYGWFDDVEMRAMYVGPTLRSITTEDLFRHTRSGRLWKVFRVTANEPAGILTSYEVDTRLVLASDRYALLP